MSSLPKSPAEPSKILSQPPASDAAPPKADAPALPPEFGGRKGPEATRYGDWEMNGKCVDF